MSLVTCMCVFKFPSKAGQRGTMHVSLWDLPFSVCHEACSGLVSLPGAPHFPRPFLLASCSAERSNSVCSFSAAQFRRPTEKTREFTARESPSAIPVCRDSWALVWRTGRETRMLFASWLREFFSPAMTVSGLMILNHVPWPCYSPVPLYFSQILLQTIINLIWPKLFLLLIVFRCPAYGVAKIKYKCVKNKDCSQAISIEALLIKDGF